jgi:hypothetical protein
VFVLHKCYIIDKTIAIQKPDWQAILMRVIEDLCLLAYDAVDLCMFTGVLKLLAASICRGYTMLMVFCALDIDRRSVSIIVIFFQTCGLL